MDAPALRERLTSTLLQDMQEVQYPSITMLDRIEEALEAREQLAEYAETLIEKVEDTQYPGIPLLDRVNSVLGRLEELEFRERVQQQQQQQQEG